MDRTSPNTGNSTPIRIFYSYSHKDERLKNVLETHLSPMRREGLVLEWYDRRINAGESWKKAIDDNLEKADIILLLVSADFVASDYCYEIEMQRAMERHDSGEAHVIPIILRHVDWHNTPFGKLQALPTDGKPIEAWSIRSKAWLEVARGIRRVARAKLADSQLVQQPRLTQQEVTSKNATPPSPALTSQVSRQTVATDLSFQWTVASDKNREFTSIGEALESYFDSLDFLQENQGAVVGVPTGFLDLDQITGGFQDGDLIILAARPGVGKTSFALNLAYNAALQGRVVALLSLETPLRELTSRIVSMQTGVDSHRLRLGRINDEEWEDISRVFGEVAPLHLLIDYSHYTTAKDLADKIRVIHKEWPLDFIVVDSLRMLEDDPSAVTRSLKLLASELGIPVLAVISLPRNAESRSSHIPMMSDLRASDDVEQDADMVLFIYREELYDPETEKKGLAELHIAKHRNGPLGVVNLRFIERSGRFADLELYRESGI